MYAYHIDRQKLLRPDLTIHLKKYIISDARHLNIILDERFPEGLSFHGSNYYYKCWHNPKKDFLEDILTENIFEYERVLHFPFQPSRLQSFFALETQEDVITWQEILNDFDAPVWEIEFDHRNYAKLDASWLRTDINCLSFLQAAHFAKNYWNGTASERPKWELLVHPPIRTIREIPLEDLYLKPSGS